MKKSAKSAFSPDLSVKYAPRINRRFAEMTDRVAAREQIRKGDVLQYCLEAAVAAKVESRKWKVESGKETTELALDAMLTVRTSRKMRERIQQFWRANPNMLEADVLRSLLEWGLRTALAKRISYVMKLRESAI